MATDWYVYCEDSNASDKRMTEWLSNPPPWRRMGPGLVGSVGPRAAMTESAERRARSYVTSGPSELMNVNMALLLRRPVLVTGLPGIGKTSLGYSVAGRLGLGTPLRWNINSQTTLRDGLYIYDAVAHLGATRATGGRDIDAARSIGDYISLGPLGCAMLPSDRPRMLIVDEIDKANFDLAHDLLHVFEEGGFDIPELARLPGMASIHGTSASGDPCRVDVKAGRIITRHHPVVVITSNGVREFPEAFRRRCVELKLVRPPAERLRAIVANQLGDAAADEGLLEVENALKDQATDVVLQTLFLRGAGASVEDVAVVLKR